MLILIKSDKLDFDFSFNQSSVEVLEGLRASFIEKFGYEFFAKASKIIVVEDNFYNVIKDRYGPTLIGEINDQIYDLIDAHLSI